MQECCHSGQTGVAAGVGVGAEPDPKAGVLDVLTGNQPKNLQGHPEMCLYASQPSTLYSSTVMHHAGYKQNYQYCSSAATVTSMA